MCVASRGRVLEFNNRLSWEKKFPCNASYISHHSRGERGKESGFLLVFFYLGGKTFHARKDLFRNEGSSSGDTIF